MFYFNASVKSFYINMFLYLPSFLRGSVFSFFSVKSLVVTDTKCIKYENKIKYENV